jgi:hypothetical protein
MCADFLQKNWGMSLSINCELPTTLYWYALQGPRSEHAYLLEVKKNTQFVVQKILSVTLLRKHVVDSESRYE